MILQQQFLDPPFTIASLFASSIWNYVFVYKEQDDTLISEPCLLELQ